MKKRWIAPILLATLLLAGPAAEDAAAQKGGSSSGRSFSSGRSSPSGRSFSSGRTTPAPRVAPSGKSSTPTTKPGGTIKIPSTTRPTTPSRPSVPPPSSSGRTYTSPGGLTTKGGSASGRSYTNLPPRPAAPAFDTLAASEQRKAESRATYQQATRPRDTYKAPSGTVKKIDATDAGSIRNRLDHDRWVTRDDRVRRQFPDTYNRPPVIFYNDPYSSWFWYWLLARDLNQQAYWAYHHRNRMDDARYRELLGKNDKLEHRIKEIEKENIPRDPTWSPQGVEPDLMYGDEYVDAVFNPQPAAVEPWDPPPAPPVRPSSPEEVTAAIVVVLLIVGFLIWLVFFKRWGSTCVGGPRVAKERAGRS